MVSFRRKFKRRRRKFRKFRRKGRRKMGVARMAKIGFLNAVSSERKTTTNILVPTGIIPAFLGGLNLPLTGIAQGDLFTERIGHKVLAKTIFVRLALYQPPLLANRQVCGVRIMITLDKKPISGTTPIFADILGGTVRYTSNISTVTSGRFDVIFDKTYRMGDSTDTFHNVYFFKKLNKTLRWGGTAGNAHSLNNITFHAFSNLVADVAVQRPVCEYHIRTRYTDS